MSETKKRKLHPPGLKAKVGLLAGIETMHMIRKGRLHGLDGKTLAAANQFHSPAF